MSRATKPKRKNPFQNNMADRYYESRQTSVIRHSRLESAGPAIVTPHVVDSDLNVDKYYANGGSPASQRGRPRPGTTQRIGNERVTRPLTVQTKEELKSVRDEVITLLNNGERRIIVQLATPELASAFDTQLDLAVGRKDITRDQRRRVKIEKLPESGAEVAEQLLGVPDIRKLPLASGDEPLPDDFDAFIKGEMLQEQKPAEVDEDAGDE